MMGVYCCMLQVQLRAQEKLSLERRLRQMEKFIIKGGTPIPVRHASRYSLHKAPPQHNILF